jgi:acyl carrier protein
MHLERTRRELSSIWATVLNVSQVADADDFFDLGGDSLAAARMTSMAQHVDVPLRAVDVLKNPQFADLVAVVHRKVMHDTP